MDAGTAIHIGRIFRVAYGGNSIDFIDQLNYQFSSGLLFVVIGIIGIRHYVGKPIQCWVPQEYSRAWEEYAENVCWISNTYFLMPHDPVPTTETELKMVTNIGYYQWVVLVLAGQAMLLWVPHLLWRIGAKRLPILLKGAKEAAVPDRELRHKAVLCLVGTLEEIAFSQLRYRRTKGLSRCFRYGGIRPSSRYTLLFLFVRITYVLNSVGQIFLMRRFIAHNSIYFGVRILENLLQGYDWNLSGNFPRVTYCTFKVRKVGFLRYSTYTLQCVLPVNFFIEKLYIFLWFWFTLVACLTLLNTLQWMFNLLLPLRRVQFIRQYLRALRHFSSTDERECSRFVRNYVGCDGVFILRAVARTSSELMALDVTATLWNNYRSAKLAGVEEDIHRLLESVHRGTTSSV